MRFLRWLTRVLRPPRPRRIGPEGRARTPQEAQLQLIVETFRKAGTPVEVGPGRQFLYQAGHILVRQEYYEPVRQLLVRIDAIGREGPQTIPVIAGVRLVRLRPQAGVTQALEAIRREFGDGVATVNYVVSITPGEAGFCPHNEPEPVPEVTPPDPAPTADSGAGEGVRVVIVDTGLDPDAPAKHPWLAGVTGDPDPAVNGKNLGKYAGHGTFIAGLVRGVAPRAEVHVKAVFQRSGAIFESDLVVALDAVLTNDSPDIISMSAGSWTLDTTGLLTFHVFNETRLRHHKGVVLVTAAGNDGDRKPFWPAAAPYTVSVGALARTWQGRASFSNFGGWVDVYAPGEDLVNAFPYGTYTYLEPPHADTNRVEDFLGMARWSGTSFSTPIVAGLVAARMSHTGENGRDAAAALIGTAQAGAQAGVGAVLFPS